MLRAVLLCASIAAAITGLAAGSQTARAADGTSAGNPAPTAPASIRKQTARYRFANMCSHSGPQAGPCVTLVRIHNLSNKTCRVGVEYYRTDDPKPICTTVNTKLPKGGVEVSCTREPGNPEPGCNQCKPQLVEHSFEQGYGIVYSNCAEIGVQATIVIKEPNNFDIASVYDVKLFRLKEPPANKASQGD